MSAAPNEQVQRIVAANTEYGEIIANLAHRTALLRSELAACEMRAQALQQRVEELEAAAKPAAPGAPPAAGAATDKPAAPKPAKK